MSNFQRPGVSSNTFAGTRFENIVQKYFCEELHITDLIKQIKIPIGLKVKKEHAFDFGNDHILIECKSHTWTETGNVPSAKMYNWCNAMYSFYMAPKKYIKFFFVEMNFDQKRCTTLLEYFIEHYYYLIPSDVILVNCYTNNNNYLDVFIFDEKEQKHTMIFPSRNLVEFLK